MYNDVIKLILTFNLILEIQDITMYLSYIKIQDEISILLKHIIDFWLLSPIYLMNEECYWQLPQ